MNANFIYECGPERVQSQLEFPYVLTTCFGTPTIYTTQRKENNCIRLPKLTSTDIQIMI